MGDTDQLRAAATAALAEIDTPTGSELAEAAGAVAAAAGRAKNRGDAQLVAASEGYYEPTATDYGWVVPYFAKFHDREPADTGTMLADLSDARATLLSDTMDAVPELTGSVSGWEGSAGDSFRRNVLDPFSDTIRHQTEVLDELRCALWTYQGVLSRARTDALVIADTTTKVLESLDDFKSADATVTLSVVGSAADLASRLTSDNDLDLALLSGEPVASASVSGSHDIDGYDPDSVLDAMKRALDALEKAMNEEEANIGVQLARSNSKIDTLLGGGTIDRRTVLVPAAGPDSPGGVPAGSA